MGPMKQLQRMFDPTRLIATIVMVCALIMTLVAVFVVSFVKSRTMSNLKKKVIKK